LCKYLHICAHLLLCVCEIIHNKGEKMKKLTNNEKKAFKLLVELQRDSGESTLYHCYPLEVMEQNGWTEETAEGTLGSLCAKGYVHSFDMNDGEKDLMTGRNLPKDIGHFVDDELSKEVA